MAKLTTVRSLLRCACCNKPGPKHPLCRDCCPHCGRRVHALVIKAGKKANDNGLAPAKRRREKWRRFRIAKMEVRLEVERGLRHILKLAREAGDPADDQPPAA